jgi:hypothetical protein
MHIVVAARHGDLQITERVTAADVEDLETLLN